ncbi:phenylalanyl-tRNA synthetase, beta subunit [Synechococcus sp. PCC 7502]|uniref:phenylalanine--tRNA ligase subunit beta n=1 Tax=Synechococcus sp. PCC 7502 TaxID=1173263 RepID=UPI00029FF1CE|nr:phenylalanine--tRNA ligase subunit beta [Synechococcus sp. PCC 7502]AFY73600.1 phenylalanyl-tRNA synthetase, beta subunit [Synechococcus sp. PCC 7502]
MHISLNWLQELVSFSLSPQEVADALTMAGFEVEGIEDRRTWADGVVVGKILNAERHPQADRLQVCTVDVGGNEPLNIVCGAANARTGLYVPVATIGTYLPTVDLKLRPTKLRGVRSEGMICSLSELGLAKESSGIHEFPEGVTIGADVRPLLGLDDVILDVSSTANRADALSMVGMARELGALIGEKVKLPIAKSNYEIKSENWVSVDSRDAVKACPAYIGTLIKGIKVQDSPQWLQRRIQAAGMRSINNIVDITNYILLEWGQPLHGFDADTLGSDLESDLKIGVRFAREQETLITLDGQTRNLSSQNLLITSGDIPVAIAGVMGGKETEVSDRTVNLVLEAALFDQTVVRKSARAQGLRTEASARYERGVNQAGLEIATARALELILELAGGEIISQSISDRRPTETRKITLRLERVQEVLGSIETEDGDSVDLSAEIVTKVLTALSFELKANDELKADNLHPDTWEVAVPTYRYADIEREIDLIEEIARIYGYDKFQETLPPRTELGYLGTDELLKRQIRECLRGVGLTEVTHSSLCSPTQSTQVKITNPVALEYSALRLDLLSGLIEAFAYNLNQGNGWLWGFEIGRVFWQDEEGSVEADHVGGIFGGDPTVGTWQHNTKPLDWYAAKGVLETVFQRLGVTVEYQPDQQNSRLHPGRTASLWISGERLGTFGQLHPQVCQIHDLPSEIYAFELDLGALLEAIDRKAITIFQGFSSFPPSDRDIAFFVPLKVSVAEIQRAITFTGGNLLESVQLFDQYLGEGVPQGLRSLAFRLIYRASDRTLTDADINPVHQKIRDVLEEKFRATLRS